MVLRNTPRQAANDPHNERIAAALFAVQAEEAESLKRSIDAGMSYPACKGGPCEQGRKPSPSPEACRLPESRFNKEGRSLLLWFAGALALVGGALAVAMWWQPGWLS